MRAVELASGEREPASLERVLPQIRVSVLLVASDAKGERPLDQVFQRRIGSRANLWYLRGVGHTDGLAARPVADAERVTRFFSEALTSPATRRTSRSSTQGDAPGR